MTSMWMIVLFDYMECNHCAELLSWLHFLQLGSKIFSSCDLDMTLILIRASFNVISNHRNKKWACLFSGLYRNVSNNPFSYKFPIHVKKHVFPTYDFIFLCLFKMGLNVHKYFLDFCRVRKVVSIHVLVLCITYSLESKFLTTSMLLPN